MKEKVKSLVAVTGFWLLFMLAGCVSTDVIGEENEMNGETISLNMTVADPRIGTRASTDHVLRYSALLYTYADKSIDQSYFLERQEILASDDSKGTITFKVPSGSYNIVLIGDYIPADSEKGDGGRYPDRYYDTSLKDQNIKMRSFTDPNTSVALGFNCVNNDNYDCFATVIKVDKGDEKIEKDITLHRIVSKVRFVSKTSTDKEISGISIQLLSLLTDNIVLDGGSGNQIPIPFSGSGYQLTGMSDPTQNELFYFYTMGTNSERPTVDNGGALGQMKFKVSFSDGTYRESDILGGLVLVRQDYITTVTGSFFPAAPIQGENGDIILNLSKPDEWKGSSKEIDADF